MHDNDRRAGWSVDNELAEAVCDHIGWWVDVHPIMARARDGVVQVRGTALKPDEWAELERWSGTVMPDGREMIVMSARRTKRAKASWTSV